MRAAPTTEQTLATITGVWEVLVVVFTAELEEGLGVVSSVEVRSVEGLEANVGISMIVDVDDDDDDNDGRNGDEVGV